MKIRELHLKNFRRFTDTRITDIPDSARLVILAGPNGCGKSSVIDAAHVWQVNNNLRVANFDETYHVKQLPDLPRLGWNNVVTVAFHDPVESQEAKRKAIYVRSAYRNDPEFQLDSLERVGPVLAERRFRRLIENDQVVGLNYKRLVSTGVEQIFEQANDTVTLREFRERMIGEVREAMSRLFPGLYLNSLGNPLAGGTFRFDKDESKAFAYKNLSGGEKAAFDLLLDVIVKRVDYNDTVYLIDEPEAHMAVQLQEALLDELLRAIPDNSQLWLATHSVGMMRKALQLGRGNPGSVVFLDFDGVNFDLPQVLRPTEPDRPFWKRALQIALADLAGYVAPAKVVLCEGGLTDGGRDFDADCYNRIFEAEYPDVLFAGAGNADSIQNDPRGIANLLRSLAPGVQIERVIDRDDRTDAEISAARERGVRVLSLRTIESFLLGDSVLAEVCRQLGRAEASGDLIEAKRRAIESIVANGHPRDDLKKAAGDIYNVAKRLFPDKKLGSDGKAFMKGICAPAIRATPAYTALRRDIFE